jgi:hypothetical protein
MIMALRCTPNVITNSTREASSKSTLGSVEDLNVLLLMLCVVLLFILKFTNYAYF